MAIQSRFGAALAAAVLLLAAAFVGSPASAQPCCTATGSSEVSVVGRCHESVIGSKLSLDHATGSYSPDGGYRSLGDARADDLVVTLGAGTRLWTRSLQVHGEVPARLQYRRFGGEGDTSAGLGDAGASLRWTALEDTTAGLLSGDWEPFLDLHVGARLPTGRAPEEGTAASGADITGTGTTALTAGLRLTKFITSSDALTATATGAYPFARDVDWQGRETVHYAPGFDASYGLSWLHIIDVFWSYGFNVSYLTEGATEHDGTPVDDSELRRLRLGAHLTHVLSLPDWELTADASFDPPIGDIGQNVSFAGATVGLTLRRNFGSGLF